MGRHNLKFGAAIATVASLFAIAGGAVAHADTFSYTISNHNLTGYPVGSEVFTFNSDTIGVAPTTETSTPAGVTATFTGGNATVEKKSVKDLYLKPKGDKSKYLVVSYPNSSGTETVKLSGGPYKNFGLYWGSIDTYNTITFLGAGGTPITGGSFTGTTFLNELALLGKDSTSGSNGTSSYVEFTDSSGANITGVEFSTSQPAFEADNLSVAGGVPEPATWAMMLIGFGLVGLQLRRRTVKEVTC